MNKKAVAWGIIIGGIAAIVIIATLLTPLKGVWHVVGERIFGMVSPPSAEEFVPYVGPTSATIAMNSFKAFVCGSKIIYFQDVNYSKQCPDGIYVNITGPAACSGVTYGSTCVECGQEVQRGNNYLMGLVCNVKHFELPEDAPYVLSHGFVVSTLGKMTSWVSPSAAQALTGYNANNPTVPWIIGVGDPSYLMYYERFPEGEDAWWHVDAFSFNIMYVVTSTGFNALFGAGGASAVKSAAKKVALEAAEQAVKQGATTTAKAQFRQTVKNSLKLGGKAVLERNILVKGYRFIGRQLKNLFLRDTAEKAAKASMTRWALSSAEEAMLSPQAVDRIVDGLLRKGFITRAGALTISQAELKAIIKEEASQALKLGITETENLVKKAGGELLERQSTVKTGRLWRNTLTAKDEFWGAFNQALMHSDEKIRADLLKAADAGSLAQALKQQDLQLYTRIMGNLKMINAPPGLKDDFINLLAKDAKTSVDAAASVIEKQTDDFAEKYAKEIVEKYSGKVTADMIKKEGKKMAVIGYMDNFVQADGKFAKREFITNLVEGDGKKIMDAFDKLPKEYQQKAIISAFETAEHMGEKDFTNIIKRLGDSVDEFAVKDATLLTRMGARLDKIDEYIKIVPFVGSKAVAFKNAGLWAAKLPPKGVYHSAKFIRDHRVLLFVLTYMIADWQDSKNEKWIDRGSDTLVLNSPSNHPDADYWEPLPENFSYISLQRDGERAPLRFHMISPCLTDLKLYGVTEPCVLNENIYQYNVIPFEDTGKFPASRSKIDTPVLSNSVIFKDDPASRIEYPKIIETIERAFDRDVWYSIEELGLGKVSGTPDWFYKLTAKGGLYIMTGDEVFIYRYDPYYNAIFSDKWYDQYDYIAEKAKKIGIGQWHSGNNVGGFLGWEYLVAGYSVSYGYPYIVMFARNKLTGAYQRGLGRDLGSKYAEGSTGQLNLTQDEISKIRGLPQALSQNIPAEQPPAYLLKYINRFENQNYPFFENAYKKDIYTLPYVLGMGGGRSFDWYLRNINSSTANYEKRTAQLKKIFDDGHPLYLNCIQTGKDCVAAASKYKQVIGLIVLDEQLPPAKAFYRLDLGQLTPIILEDQIEILNNAENALADIYAVAGSQDFKDLLSDMGSARQDCLDDIDNGAVEKTLACEVYLGFFLSALGNMTINLPGEPSVSLVENNTQLPFTQDQWYIFHRLSGVLKERAMEIMAIYAYFNAPVELQTSLYALDKSIEDTKTLHDDCVENKNYSACKDALEGYQNILYNQGAGYFEQSEIPIDQIEERMETAEELMLDIFRSAADYRELFEIVGLPKDYCDSVSLNERFWCIVNTLKEETPYFSSLRATISKDGEAGMSLLGVIASGDPLFSDRDYDIVKGNVRLNIFLEGREIRNPKYEHFWSSPEIATYVYYKNMDCMQAATIMSTIPAFAKLYDLDEPFGQGKNEYAGRCAIGFNAIYPAYLEKKMIPFFSSRRPAIMYYDAFGEYIIPELRRIEKDRKFSDDTYEELIEKNNYYQTKAKILEMVNQQQAYFKKIADINVNDYRLWLEIQKQLGTRFPQNIVVNGVRVCDKDNKDSLLSTFGTNSKRTIKIPAISVEPSFAAYKNDSNKANYCYAIPLSWFDRNAEWAILVAGIFVDASVEAFVYSTTGNLLLARAAVAVTGAAQAVMLEEIRVERAWPGQNQHYTFQQA